MAQHRATPCRIAAGAVQPAVRVAGADRTRIYYVGLKGVGTDHKRRAVQAVYELKPMPEASDIKELGCAQVE